METNWEMRKWRANERRVVKSFGKKENVACGGKKGRRTWKRNRKVRKERQADHGRRGVPFV